MPPEKKRRRSNLVCAAGFALFGLVQAYAGYRAQLNDTVVRYKTGWYTPEAAYFAAFCFFALAAYLILASIRGSKSRTD